MLSAQMNDDRSCLGTKERRQLKRNCRYFLSKVLMDISTIIVTAYRITFEKNDVVLKHSYFIDSSGITKLGFCKSWCAPISLKLPWSWSRAPKNFLRHKYAGTFLFYRFNQSVKSPTCHLESVWRRTFFLGSETAPWKF